MAKKLTQGKFTVVDKTGKEIHSGHSTQMEIVFRDYCGWCLKNKAPKNMQAAFDAREDKNLKPTDVFVLQMTEMDDASFSEATKKSAEPKASKLEKLLAAIADELKSNPDKAEEIRKALAAIINPVSPETEQK
jgi:hypothetical protein